MSLYKDYLKERENKEVLESEEGFISYEIYKTGICYIQDIYVIPELRNSGLTAKMQKAVIEIAKECNCHTLLGSVCIDGNDATRNLKILLNDNWQVDRLGGNMIYLTKKIVEVV